MHHVRHIAVEAKQTQTLVPWPPPPPAHCTADSSAFSPVTFTSFPFRPDWFTGALVLPLSHPKSAFRVSGNRPVVSHPAAPWDLYLSLPRSRGALAERFSEVTSHSCTRLLGRSAIFVPIVARRRHWDKKERLFASRWLSVTLFYGIEAKDGFWYVLGASLRFTPWLHSQKLENFDLAKVLAPIQTGGPPQMASERHTSFCQKQGKDSEFPYGPSFRIWIWGTQATCVFLPPYLLPSLSLSIRFPRQHLPNFHIHIISRKEFWGSLWSRSFSYIQKPEGSKTLLYAYLSGGEGTKFLPLLNILKSSLLTIPVSQGGEGPSFPHSCKFP